MAISGRFVDAGPASFTNFSNSASNLSSGDLSLLSQFGVSNTGAIAGHTGYNDIENYLNSKLSPLDQQIKQMQALQGTSNFNQSAYDTSMATRNALNKIRLGYTLQNNNSAQQSGDPNQAAVYKLLSVGNAQTLATIQAMGGPPDASVLSDPAAAKTWLDQFKSTQAAQATAAANAQAAAQTAQQNTADAASLAATTSQQFASANDAYQAALNTAGTTFDSTVASQQAGRQSQNADLMRGLGFAGTSTASGEAEGLATTQAAADRKATLSDASQTAAGTLASAYENALNTNISGTSLNTQQQAQVHAQAADQLAATIQQEYASLSVEQQSQLANVQNLLSQYQNQTLSDEQKQTLLGKIIQGVLGAGGAVAGAFLGGAGGAIAGASAGNAAGAAIGQAA